MLRFPRYENCVFTGNQSAGSGGGLYGTGTQPIVRNTIIRANTPNQIYDASGETTVVYSNIQGGFHGVGNIDADPRFVDPGSEIFELQSPFPCINTGTASSTAVTLPRKAPGKRLWALTHHHRFGILAAENASSYLSCRPAGLGIEYLFGLSRCYPAKMGQRLFVRALVGTKALNTIRPLAVLPARENL